MELTDLGWDERWAAEFESVARPGLRPARVAIEFNHIFRVFTADGELEATTAGRLKHRAAHRSELPAVGDWVAVRTQPSHERGAIVSVLPRRSRFSRKAAGDVTDEQVVAANVDVVFVVMSLDNDYNLRRLDRYLLLARESGASPVVLLTKPDLAPDLESEFGDAVVRAGDAPVHVLSPKLNAGLEHVSSYLGRGRTAALLGSSGVGKSTIINRLAGIDRQRTRDVRAADSRGRHTTTNRELVILPGGGLIIDTPGMRELQLWDVSDAMRETFDDVDALAAYCHFTDCRHRGEPRCAVAAAIAAGDLPAERLEAYLKLRDEIASVERQQDVRAQLDEKRRSKVMGKALRQHLKTKRFGQDS
jgi:ribosome biogenesis GTPase / thiamine phosphate phosphatase